MHNQAPLFEHPLLSLALVVVNIPLYVVFWRTFFGSRQDFVDCLCSISIVKYSLEMYKYRFGWGPVPDREVDALYAALRLLLFVLGVISCVVAEYHLIAWLLFR